MSVVSVKKEDVFFAKRSKKKLLEMFFEILNHATAKLYLTRVKKRHQQKLAVLSIGLVLLFNLPLVLIFNFEQAVFGIPVLYAYLFSVWLLSIAISYFVMRWYA